MSPFIRISKEEMCSKGDQCIVMTIDGQKCSKVLDLMLTLPNERYVLHRSYFALDENVLVIGGGPSGKDILYEIARSANRVTFSHHRDLSKNNFGTNVTQKGDVRKFTENGVEFADGSTDIFTSVLFCTG